MKKILLVFLASLVFPAQAAIQLVDPVTGKLIGAMGVDVGGSFFDVHFAGGSCISIFSGCNSAASLPFGGDPGMASLGALALLDQVLLDTPEGEFDSKPSLTWGIGRDEAEILTPWDTPDTGGNPDKPTLRVYSAYNTTKSDSLLLNEYFCCEGLREFEAGTGSRYVYAVWAPSVSALPEPEIYAMMTIGLGLLGYLGRRRKKAG